MKSKHLVIVLGILLFSSCIVKSIRPFYIKEKIKFEPKLVGNWTSGKTGTWEILSFKAEWEKENEKEDKSEMSEEDKKSFEIYKDAYVVNYTSNEKGVTFFAMPFMVGDDLFLDFKPFDYDTEGLNGLAEQHILNTHSAAFVDFQEDGSIKLKWIDESVVKKLIDENKIRINHEIIGLEEDLVLTASSEELYKFLEKFVKSDIKKKWDSDSIKTLKRADAKS